MADDKASNSNANQSFSDDDEETVTVAQVLAGIAENESTAAAVLGGSDTEHCSYNQGYVKRQALYACLTCNDPKSPNFKPAGLCLACTLKCHADHDLVELYTKRNFRCDCGTSKFPNVACTLQPMKDEMNEKNQYNHNFEGVYCTCRRPYPDPEEDEEDEDEMIQCVICEDWLHGRHINNDEVDTETDINEAEFICEICAKKNTFLSHYHSKLQVQVVKPDEDNASSSMDVITTDSDPGVTQIHGESKESKLQPIDVDKSAMTSDDSSSQDSGLVLLDDTDMISNSKNLKKRPHSSGDTCLLDTVCNTRCEIDGGTFWRKDWRLELCKCYGCMKVYEESNVAFLLDNEDLLEVYEAKGKEKGSVTENIEQQLIQSAFSRLDHVGKIEFMHGVQEFKQGLGELLKQVGESGRALTERDVHSFFEGLHAKRRRMN